MPREMFGSVRASGKRWLGRYHVAGKAYFTPTRERKGQVRDDLAAVRAEILAGTWVPPRPRKRGVKPATAAPGRPTVEEYGRAWLADLERAGHSPSTLRSYRSNLTAHIVPAIGGLLLDEVGTGDVAGVIARIDRARKTKVNVLRALSSMLAHAHKAGVISKVPTLPSVEGRSEPSKRRALTAPELRAVLAAADEDVRAVFALASWCALRYGEVAALDVGAIDTAAWTVRVERAVKRDPSGRPVLGPPKSRAGYRSVSIPPQAREDVAAYLSRRGGGPGLLFPCVPGWGGYWSDRALRARLKDACVRAGVEPVGLHELRHTGLTLFGQAGATLADLMYRAGHTSADTVMIYQHSTAERDRELAARMG